MLRAVDMIDISRPAPQTAFIIRVYYFNIKLLLSSICLPSLEQQDMTSIFKIHTFLEFEYDEILLFLLRKCVTVSRNGNGNLSSFSAVETILFVV